MTSMIAQCPSCLTEFELDLNKVPLTGLRARCSVCSAVISVPAASVAQRRPQSAQTTARSAETPASTPVSAPVSASVSAPSSTAAAADVQASPVIAGTASTDASAHTSTEPQRSAHVTESGESEATASVAPAVQHPTSAHASAPASDAPKEAPRRRPVNPFLTRDPALRAKRLARALVSDIVAYHPAKHAEGLRDGTLKTLFKEEIRKSYEEYVEQVGREFAESTTHFKDALNDVLAGGRLQF